MVTKKLIKKSKHEVYSIIWNSYFTYFYVFVLLESSGHYAETPNAFIFSLNNFETLEPFVSKPKKTGRAIFRHSYYGPMFGNDLVIHLDAANIKDSKAHLGTYYSVPAAVQNRLTVLAGTKYFSPDEVEVFYLDTSH